MNSQLLLTRCLEARDACFRLVRLLQCLDKLVQRRALEVDVGKVDARDLAEAEKRIVRFMLTESKRVATGTKKDEQNTSKKRNHHALHDRKELGGYLSAFWWC
jgi:hypothetical protein